MVFSGVILTAQAARGPEDTRTHIFGHVVRNFKHKLSKRKKNKHLNKNVCVFVPQIIKPNVSQGLVVS